MSDYVDGMANALIDGQGVIWPKPEELTLKDVCKIHRVIWEYAVRMGSKPDTPYECDCILCEWSGERQLENPTARGTCSHCPARWPNGRTCRMWGSLYLQWAHSPGHSKERTELAERIRDIPFFFWLKDEVDE